MFIRIGYTISLKLATLKMKINVKGVAETMIQTLYARAKETSQKNPQIKDEMAVSIVKQ